MRRPLLDALSIFSLIVLAFLALGCFAIFGLRLLHNAAGPTPHALQIVLQFQRGRIAFYWETWNPPPANFPLGTHLYSPPIYFSAPDFRRAFWQFDAHSLPLPNGLHVFLIAFPIWLAALPFFIPPLLWLRHHPTQKLSAFPIVDPSPRKANG
jgi:hypothetical protein